MYTVTCEIDFCYGHRLLNYPGKCRHLHGHNGKAEIDLYAKRLNALGMVRDFEEIKAIVKRWINDTLDHKMILCKNDPLISALDDLNETYFIIDQNPTAEVISKLIFDYAISQDLPVAAVRLWETDKSCASYSE